MKKRLLYLKSFLAFLTLATMFGLVTASAQVSSQGGAQASAQDNDTTRAELASFDSFMDSHPEIAEQLRKDPSLVKNDDFVRDHHALQEYLQQHPGVREEITENPDRFMHKERRFDRAEDRRNEGRRDRDNDRRDNDRRDNDTTRGELASFDRFMDGHHEIAEQLRKDPSLVKNQDFVRNHPDLQEYLQQHPGVQQEISENPDRFIHQEQRFDRAEDQRNDGRDADRRDADRRDNDARGNDRRDNDRRDNDTTRNELASFDRFMDGHHEIAEQLRRDPSLVKNQDFVRNHPDLQEYLQQHPGVTEEISENPDRFMRQEQRYDRAEDARNNYRPDPDNDRRDNDRRDNDRRDNDTTRGELANFDRFMDGHPEIAEQVRRDPSLMKNETFVQSHPALQAYLQQNPEVHEEITENPDRFMRQEQHFDRMEDRRGDEMPDRDRDAFGEFLGSHSSIAQDLNKDPRLANSEDYQKNHPDFQQYLKTHPGVQAQLKQNPQMFVKSAQPTGTSPAAAPTSIPPASTPKSPTVEPLPKAPTVDPMPKP